MMRSVIPYHRMRMTDAADDDDDNGDAEDDDDEEEEKGYMYHISG